jgi:hypothetical protein
MKSCLSTIIRFSTVKIKINLEFKGAFNISEISGILSIDFICLMKTITFEIEFEINKLKNL